MIGRSRHIASAMQTAIRGPIVFYPRYARTAKTQKTCITPTWVVESRVPRVEQGLQGLGSMLRVLGDFDAKTKAKNCCFKFLMALFQQLLAVLATTKREKCVSATMTVQRNWYQTMHSGPPVLEEKLLRQT